MNRDLCIFSDWPRLRLGPFFVPELTWTGVGRYCGGVCETKNHVDFLPPCDWPRSGGAFLARLRRPVLLARMLSPFAPDPDALTDRRGRPLAPAVAGRGNVLMVYQRACHRCHAVNVPGQVQAEGRG